MMAHHLLELAINGRQQVIMQCGRLLIYYVVGGTAAMRSPPQSVARHDAAPDEGAEDMIAGARSNLE